MTAEHQEFVDLCEALIARGATHVTSGDCSATFQISYPHGVAMPEPEPKRRLVGGKPVQDLTADEQRELDESDYIPGGG